MLASTIISSITLATATIVSLNSNNDDSRILATSGNIENQTITFDSSHYTPVTEHGNSISSAISGSMRRVSGYLCGMYSASNDAQFYTETPVQSISKIEITWKGSTLYQLFFSVGTNKGGSNIYRENQVSIMGGSTGKTTTIKPSNPSETHYLTITAQKWDTTSTFYITSIVITYSCSY